jgi:hypothetical protein
MARGVIGSPAVQPHGIAEPDTIIRDAQTLCVAQIFVDSILNRAGSELGRFSELESSGALYQRCPVASAEFPPSLPALRTPDGGHSRRTRAVP